MQTHKTVLFDLGRVLIHYDHQATLAGLAAVSAAEAQDLHTLTGGDLGVRMGTGEMNARQFHQFLMEEAGTTANFDEFVQAYAAGIQRDEEALAYALSLTKRTHLQVGIISNTNEAHAIWLHANLPELKHFSHVILSNEVGLIKPDARIYKLSLDTLDTRPSDALFVDDLAANVDGAKALGMAGIVHTDWATSRPQLETWIAQS